MNRYTLSFIVDFLAFIGKAGTDYSKCEVPITFKKDQEIPSGLTWLSAKDLLRFLDQMHYFELNIQLHPIFYVIDRLLVTLFPDSGADDLRDVVYSFFENMVYIQRIGHNLGTRVIDPEPVPDTPPVGESKEGVDEFSLKTFFNGNKHLPCKRIRDLKKIQEEAQKLLVQDFRDHPDRQAVIITSRCHYTIAFLVEDPDTKKLFWLLIDGKPYFNSMGDLSSVLRYGDQSVAFHNDYEGKENGGNTLADVLSRTADRICLQEVFWCDKRNKSYTPSGKPRTTTVALIVKCRVVYNDKNGLEKESVKIIIDRELIHRIDGNMNISEGQTIPEMKKKNPRKKNPRKKNPPRKNR